MAAREKVRVARALEGLPAVAATFARGELSYSKVRALTRVATRHNESLLLDIALHGTAAHVERLVRKYRRVRQAEDAAHAQAQHHARELHYYYDDDGCMVLHARLPAEVGAVVRLAIERALDELAEDAPADPIDPPGRAAASPQGTDPANAGSGPATRTRSNVSAETFPLASQPIVVAKGRADSPRPEPTSLVEGVAAAPVVRAESDPADNALSARRADALLRMAERFLASASTATGSTADRYQVVVHVDQRSLAGAGSGPGITAAYLESEPQPESSDTTSRFSAVTAELDDGRALALETVRRLACDASLVGLVETAAGEPLSVGRRTRSISPALRRALAARDGGCRFPGCTHTRHTEGHHVVHWARGGETKLANLVTLCSFHHRLVHEGGFGVHVVHDAPERDMFVFTRPDGTRVPNVGPGPDQALQRRPRIDAGAAPLRACHRARGLTIDASTARSRWRGEPLDDGLAIDALCRAAGDSGMGAGHLAGIAAPSSRL